MKNSIITVLAIFLSACSSIKQQDKQKDKLPEAKAAAVTPVKGIFNFTGKGTVITKKGDTTIEVTYDTIPDPDRYSIRYTPKADLIAALSPYFIDKPCIPGDRKHPLYQAHIQRGQEKAAQALADFIKCLNIKDRALANLRASIVEKTGSLEALNTSMLQQFPVYQLMPNIVNYKQGEPLINYYSLDTSFVRYVLVKEGEPLAFLLYEKSGSPEVQRHSRQIYNQIRHHGHELMSFIDNIAFPGLGFFTTGMLGYVKDNYIIYSTYRQGTTYSDKNEKMGYEKASYTAIAEAAYSRANSDYSYIDQVARASLQYIREYNPPKLR